MNRVWLMILFFALLLSMAPVIRAGAALEAGGAENLQATRFQMEATSDPKVWGEQLASMEPLAQQVCSGMVRQVYFSFQRTELNFQAARALRDRLIRCGVEVSRIYMVTYDPSQPEVKTLTIDLVRPAGI